jgi:ArsR family transcriptional regulator
MNDDGRTAQTVEAQEQAGCCGISVAVSPERRRGVRCCGIALGPRLKPEEAQRLSDCLQALAHPVRLQILALLARNQGQVCVCDLEAALPVKQPTVSHHLKLLCAAGLVAYERRGIWSYYFVRREALAELTRLVSERLTPLG